MDVYDDVILIGALSDTKLSGVCKAVATSQVCAELKLARDWNMSKPVEVHNNTKSNVDRNVDNQIGEGDVIRPS